MHNARAWFIPDTFQVWTVVEQGIHKGSTLVSWPGMNYEASGFVQNNQISVFVKNRQRYRFWLTGDGFWRRDFRSDNVAVSG
jgi:hypothetical protein